MVLRTIQFIIHHKIDYGSNFAITGPFLRNWETKYARTMFWSSGDTWSVRMEEEKEEEFNKIEFKAIIIKGKEIIWEEGYNRIVVLPPFEEGKIATIELIWGKTSETKITIENMTQQTFTFRPDLKTELSYLLYLPSTYKSSPEKKWPLILYLHGAGERGNNHDINRTVGLPRRLDLDKDFPFIVISPLCPHKKWWTQMLPTLKNLVESISSSYNVDKSKIYGTGLSMGGYGIWGMSIQYPQFFAAVVPICGGGDLPDAYKLNKLPVWAFHARGDPIVEVGESIRMVEAIKKAGGNPKLTIYEHNSHDAWTETYNSNDWINWLLTHSNK